MQSHNTPDAAKISSALPWGGSLQRLEDVTKLAEQAGCLLAKRAGVVGDVMRGAAKLPIEGIRHAGRAAWNTSRSTKMKAGLLGGGALLAGGALGLGAVGSGALHQLGNATSVPEGQEHVAHVLPPDGQDKQAGVTSLVKGTVAGAKAALPAMREAFGTVRGVGGGVTQAARTAATLGKRVGGQAFSAAHGASQAAQQAEKATQYGLKLESKIPAAQAKIDTRSARQELGGGVERYENKMLGRVQPAMASTPKVAPITTGQVNKPPAPPPPPPIPQPQMAPQQNAAASPQQLTQPTGQPPIQQPATGTQAQKGQQASVAAAGQGAAAVQTPQEAGKGTLGKIRGALPWVAGAAALPIAGVGGAGAMLANRGVKEMGREGQFNNSYQGYGAPIAGSASPYGYVSGPAA